ncbi:MAG: hypothetical protein ABI551_19170 [Polyangiaceae bacterium]
MELHPDLTDLLTEFEKSGVEYLVVGAWAVGIYAEPRFTKDLDLLVGTGAENLARVVAALERYGAPRALIDDVRTMTREEFVFLGVPPARINLLGKISGVENFEAAWSRRKTIDWNGIAVHVIGLDDLRDAKRAAGRPKDLADLRSLERFERRS